MSWCCPTGPRPAKAGGAGEEETGDRLRHADQGHHRLIQDPGEAVRLGREGERCRAGGRRSASEEGDSLIGFVYEREESFTRRWGGNANPQAKALPAGRAVDASPRRGVS